MTSAGSGYIAVPQDDLAELTTMAPQTLPPSRSTASGCGTSGMWRRSGVGQLPVSFSSDIELDELTSASTTTTTLTTTAVSPPPRTIAGDQSCPLLTRLPPAVPSSSPPSTPPTFQVGNSSCSAHATSHVKRRIE